MRGLTEIVELKTKNYFHEYIEDTPVDEKQSADVTTFKKLLPSLFTGHNEINIGLPKENTQAVKPLFTISKAKH